MHLTPDQLVDIAEGATPESSMPHLAACAACRAQLNELRSMVSAVGKVGVPEPSPLFWDHFSRRVHDAVEHARLKPARYELWRWLRASGVRATIVAALALLVVVLVVSRTRAPHDAATQVAADAGARDVWSDVAADPDSDASLTLVASLTAGIGLDAAGAAGLAHEGSAEHAVTHMSDGELRELQRLLKEEMARPGA